MPSACSFETSGETGVILFCLALGMPLAEARLLAMELERSRPALLPGRASCGGRARVWSVPSFTALLSSTTPDFPEVACWFGLVWPSLRI